MEEEQKTYEELYGERDGRIASAMECYETLCERFGGKRKYIFNRKSGPARSRYYKIFARICDMRDVVPDPGFYIACQFEGTRDGVPPPFHLVGLPAMERYAKRVEDMFCEERSRVLVSSIIASPDSAALGAEAARTKTALDRLGPTTAAAMANPGFWPAVAAGAVSPHFLSVSRTYASMSPPPEYKAFLPDNLDIYRDELSRSAGAVDKFKMIFGDEIDA